MKLKQLRFPYNWLYRIVGAKTKSINSKGEITVEVETKPTILMKILIFIRKQVNNDIRAIGNNNVYNSLFNRGDIKF